MKKSLFCVWACCAVLSTISAQALGAETAKPKGKAGATAKSKGAKAALPSDPVCDDEKIAYPAISHHPDNSNQQGSHLVGQGLTGCKFPLDFSTLSATSTATLIARSCLCTNPPPKLSLFDLDQCDTTSQQGLLRCPVTSSTQICGEAKGKTVEVILVPGTFDGRAAYASTSGTGVVDYTVACAGHTKTKSTVFKCLRGWFNPNADINGDRPWHFDAGSAAFVACTRAARADYCGSGASHTKNGSRADFFLPGKQQDQNQGPECKNNSCMFAEASWDESGAICVEHARWQMTPLSNHVNDIDVAASECSGTFLQGTAPEACIAPGSGRSPQLLSRSKRHYDTVSPVCNKEVKVCPGNATYGDCTADRDPSNAYDPDPSCP